MKLYELGLYEKAMPNTLTWYEKLTAAKDAKYDYVEMSIDASEEKINRIYMSKEERLKLIRNMYKTDMPIRSMCVSALTKYSLGNMDESLADKGMEIAVKAITLAADIGVRVVMIPGYDVYYEPSNETTKKRYFDNLKRIVEMAEKTGVILGLETMENEFMNIVEKAMKYVTLCESTYLKIYPDIGNLTNAAKMYKMDILEDLYLGKGNITSIHLKETLPGRFREVPYGTGHVDFESAIKKSWELGVRRYVAEFWYLDGEDWRGDLEKVYIKLSAILNRQGKGNGI